jgi:hypothetical protein
MLGIKIKEAGPAETSIACFLSFAEVRRKQNKTEQNRKQGH